MKFLSDSNAIQIELKRLMRDYPAYRWAVAWASNAFDCCEILRGHEDRIKQMIVGMHFYQTHPDFIEHFLDTESVRFIMNPSGVFHPKLYFFEDGKGAWECIIGSPNFTHSAFSNNAEIAVLMSNKDEGADAAHLQMSKTLNGFWDKGRRLSSQELEGYRSIWKRQQSRLHRLSGQYASSEKGSTSKAKSPLDVPFFLMPWKEYVMHIQDDKHHSTEGRLKVLEEAHKLFTAHQHFSDMDTNSRKGIAGIVHEASIDWLWFGSMKGAGFFKNSVITNNPSLSLALDQIPLAGEVTRHQYENFISHFKESVAQPGIATATRLLAMKRPDYFICLDSKNRDKLCEAFKITKNINFDRYWEWVVERIMDSAWWHSPEPTEPFDRRIWQGRAAFLDALFYDPGHK